jgi:hypothetical protein
VLDLAPSIVLDALKRLRASLQRPHVEIAVYLTRLEFHGLAGFVAKLREYQALL